MWESEQPMVSDVLPMFETLVIRTHSMRVLRFFRNGPRCSVERYRPYELGLDAYTVRKKTSNQGFVSSVLTSSLSEIRVIHVTFFWL